MLYDGVHYDVFVKKDNENGVFDSNDANIKNEVLEIAKELKKLNKGVDTKNFKIKCNVCYTLLKGDQDVIEHSKKTKHTNYVQL